MQHHKKSYRALTVVILAVGAIALTGCNDQRPDGTQLSLVQAKSAAQLLRNDTIQRLDQDVIAGVLQSAGTTEACGDPADDPDELLREWHSVSTAVIVANHIGDVESIRDDLVSSLEDDGWNSVFVGSSSVLRLTNQKSPITLEISVTADRDSISVEGIGPCVLTDGPDSDEVTDLQGVN